MKFCIECGHKLNAAQEFCTECGAKQPLTKEAPVTETRTNLERSVVKAEKKKPNKLAIILAAAGIFLLVAGFAAYKVGESLTGPEKVIEEFSNNIKAENIDEVMKAINMGQTDIEADRKMTEGYIEFLQDQDELLASSLKDLEEQGERLGSDTKPASGDLENSLFTIKKDGKKWLVFDRYIISVKPYYVNVYSNFEGSKVYVNDDQVGKIKEDEPLKVGPILPGEHELKIVYKGEYSNLEDQMKLDFSEAENNILEADLELEAAFVDVYSNYEDATLFINGKDSGMLVEDAYEIGPFAIDGTITLHAEKEFETGTIKSDEVTIEDSGSIELYIDYEEPVEPELDEEYFSTFMHEYGTYSVAAINNNDFSIVQNFLNPEGPAYQESKDYIEHTSEKGITEELLALTVGNVETIDENNVKVFTFEEYDITYGDGTTKYKKFVSSYQLTLVEGEYLIHKLLSTEEVDEF
jgi:membrane-associated protein TcaA